MKTVDLWLDEKDLTVDDVAQAAGLTPERIEAIAMGRWTPNPSERQKVASAMGVQADQVSWGHTMDPRNVRYRQFGLKKDFRA